MKSKFKLSIPFLMIFVMLISFGFAGCSLTNNNGKTPEEIIQNTFGNEEYKISFSSETLDEPLEDMTYSANKIPKLPTPKKVGYIFEGWFLDPEFVMPYTDGSLYLSMKDITLFPKWSKETFVYDGTYDVEFNAIIVEDTVKKGKTTDQYGGYRKFPDALIREECCIEKNGNDLYLKLKFDSGANIAHQSSKHVYEVSVNSKLMGSDIYVKPHESIDSLADPVKTYLIGINKWDLSTTLYLDVEWTNFENENLNELTRYDTTTYYLVAIDLTKIIGFSQPFVDTSVPLEEGYYLAKSYYRGENNLGSMGNKYNPVYSYIYSDGNLHYKLIKQNLPYVGLVARKHPLYPKITDNYYDMMTSFISLMAVYDIDDMRDVGEQSSLYYPELYNGRDYRKSVTEFHADTGKIYNIIDIDTDLKREYVALSAVSGYMEREGGMGYMKSIISIDYKTIVKLAEPDYVPLSGDNMTYESKFQYYPGGSEDLDEKNLTKNALLDGGLSIEMPNFFFQGNNIYDSHLEKTMLSCLVEVTPTKKTESKPVSESRYKIAEFNVNSKVFGYDQSDRSKGKLFIDSMCPQTFESRNEINCQLRNVKELKIGKTLNIGDKIDIEQLFIEKVNHTLDFDSVTYQAYEMSNGFVNYSSPFYLESRKFDFKKDIAIEYSYEDSTGRTKTVVELRKSSDPVIKFINNPMGWFTDDGVNYYKNGVSNVGSKVIYPEINYSWGEIRNKSFLANYYDQGEGIKSIDPSKTAIFAVRDGYNRLYNTIAREDSFTVYEKNLILIYEINNEYGERHYIFFNYASEPRKAYRIEDEDGNLLIEADIQYTKDEKTGEKHRKQVSFSYSGETVYDAFNESHIKNYTHTEEKKTENYILFGCDVYSEKGEISVTHITNNPVNKGEISEQINTYLADKYYGCVSFYYTNSYGDYLEINYLYKITFNGVDTYEALDQQALFTDIPYRFAKMNLVGSNKKLLAEATVQVQKYVDGRPSTNSSDVNSTYASDQGGQFQIIFKTPGTYKLKIVYRIPAQKLGDPASNDRYKYITFYQMVYVDSNMSDVEIVYFTDALHPFKGNQLEKTVTYNLGEGVTFIGENKNETFEITDKDRKLDNLYTWSTVNHINGEHYKKGQYLSGTDFIEEFHSKKITLYAVWEINSSVQIDVNGKKRSAYIQIDSFYDRYVLKLPSVSDVDGPQGYKFVGFTGGIFGSSEVNTLKQPLPYRTDYYDIEKYYDEYFNIRAVFKKEFSVTFKIKQDYSDTYFDSINVIDGRRIANYQVYSDVTAKTGYIFKGYFIEGDTTETIVSLKDLVITSDTKLVAKFVPA